MRRIVRDYSLSLVAFALFLTTLVGSGLAGWMEFAAEQASHGEAPQLGGEDGYLWMFLEQVFQNWQSEFLAVAILVSLAAMLVHRGSPTSRDGHEEKLQQIAAIEDRVDLLVARRRGKARP